MLLSKDHLFEKKSKKTNASRRLAVTPRLFAHHVTLNLWWPLIKSSLKYDLTYYNIKHMIFSSLTGSHYFDKYRYEQRNEIQTVAKFTVKHGIHVKLFATFLCRCSIFEIDWAFFRNPFFPVYLFTHINVKKTGYFHTNYWSNGR